MFNGFRFVDRLGQDEVITKKRKRTVPMNKWDAGEWNLNHPEGKK